MRGSMVLEPLQYTIHIIHMYIYSPPAGVRTQIGINSAAVTLPFKSKVLSAGYHGLGGRIRGRIAQVKLPFENHHPTPRFSNYSHFFRPFVASFEI